MHPEIARNQNYDNHYANDSKYVHSALLPLDDDGTRRARTRFMRRVLIVYRQRLYPQ
jgi:hypothetical protein